MSTDNPMQPVNNKSLLAFIFGQMAKLDKGEIKVEDANVQSKLIQTAINVVKLEHDRARIKMELTKHNAIYKDGTNLREIESKPFSNDLL